MYTRLFDTWEKILRRGYLTNKHFFGGVLFTKGRWVLFKKINIKTKQNQCLLNLHFFSFFYIWIFVESEFTQNGRSCHLKVHGSPFYLKFGPRYLKFFSYFFQRSLKREHLIIKWILMVTHVNKDSSLDFADWIKDGSILSK